MSEPVVITVRDNGPFLVKGPAQLVDAEGRRIDVGSRSDFVLCRCGHSANKPFCDGAHKQCGFNSDDSTSRID